MGETYISLAKKGNIHPDFQKISKSENLDLDVLMALISEGSIAIIPSNLGDCVGIGEELSSKVLCNLGTSSQSPDIEDEIKKAKLAISHGASILCDQSVGPKVKEGRRKLLNNSSVPIGTIPLYRAAEEAKRKSGNFLNFSADDLFRVFEEEIKLGVTQPGIHSMTLKLAKELDNNDRTIPIASRGGAIMYEWITHHGLENPYFAQFDRLIEICQENNVPVTFVFSMRSGSVIDGHEICMNNEFQTVRKYIRMALDADVSVVADGIGHMRLDQIKHTIKEFKKICFNIPLGVLGPAVTDRGLGHEHIVNAIGTAVAIWNGANYCNACYKTEHLGLPEISDIPEGIGASLIAVHSGDLARSGISSNLMEQEKKISIARKNNQWGKQIDLALDKIEAKNTFDRVGNKNDHSEGCSICGDMCPFLIKDNRDDNA